MEIGELLERAKGQLASATGLRPVGVTRASKDAQGWHIGVDMVEMARIPPATDVLGEYEVILGDDGAMVRFTRRRTRLRGEPMEEHDSE